MADTKRKVLSQISKVYDPLNLTWPVTIRGRVLMRKVCKWKVDWDQQVRSRNVYQTSWENRAKVGDIVLIKAPNKSRLICTLGKILELVMGYDNKVRSVKLRQGNGKIEYHSISNLYPFQISRERVEGEVRGTSDRPLSGEVDTSNGECTRSNLTNTTHLQRIPIPSKKWCKKTLNIYRHFIGNTCKY